MMFQILASATVASSDVLVGLVILHYPGLTVPLDAENTLP